MKAEVRNGELFLEGVKLPIRQAVQFVELNELLIVLTSYGQPNDNRNVYALNTSGKTIWKIQEEPNKMEGQTSPFTGLRIAAGRLYAFAAGGFEYEIDIANGHIIGEEFLK